MFPFGLQDDKEALTPEPVIAKSFDVESEMVEELARPIQSPFTLKVCSGKHV